MLNAELRSSFSVWRANICRLPAADGEEERKTATSSESLQNLTTRREELKGRAPPCEQLILTSSSAAFDSKKNNISFSHLRVLTDYLAHVKQMWESQRI